MKWGLGCVITVITEYNHRWFKSGLAVPINDWQVFTSYCSFLLLPVFRLQTLLWLRVTGLCTHTHQHIFKSTCCVTCVITLDTWWITCVHCNVPLLVTCSYIRINECQSTEQDHSSGQISLMCKPSSMGAETHRPPPLHKEQFTARANAINLVV